MNVVDVVQTVIKYHPLIEFNNGPDDATEHWGVCPCGFATKRYKTTKPVERAFQDHLAEEVNEELIAQSLLVLNEEAAQKYRGRSFVPTEPLELSYS